MWCTFCVGVDDDGEYESESQDDEETGVQEFNQIAPVHTDGTKRTPFPGAITENEHIEGWSEGGARNSPDHRGEAEHPQKHDAAESKSESGEDLDWSDE